MIHPDRPADVSPTSPAHPTSHPRPLSPDAPPTGRTCSSPEPAWSCAGARAAAAVGAGAGPPPPSQSRSWARCAAAWAPVAPDSAEDWAAALQTGSAGSWQPTWHPAERQISIVRSKPCVTGLFKSITSHAHPSRSPTR